MAWVATTTLQSGARRVATPPLKSAAPQQQEAARPKATAPKSVLMPASFHDLCLCVMNVSHARLGGLRSERIAGKCPAAVSIPEPKENGKRLGERRWALWPAGQAWFPTSTSTQTSPPEPPALVGSSAAVLSP